MKILFISFLVLASSYSYADEFICQHQGPSGNEYIVEYLNDSICMRRLDVDGNEVKFNLFPAPSPEERDHMIIFRDDENSFRLSLSHYPSSNNPARGEVVHTNEDGEVISSNMDTICN